MASSKEEKKRELVRGKKCNTVNGEKYVHHSVWIEPYTEFVLSEIADMYGIDENHLIGLIADQFIQQDTRLDESKVAFYQRVLLPNILENLKDKDNG